MRKGLVLAGILLAAVSMVGCVTLSGASICNVDPAASQKQTVDVTGFGILHLSTPSVENFEAKAVNELKAKGCTKNITTRLTMREFMLFQYYSVVATGEK